jgi:hypothetical protein
LASKRSRESSFFRSFNSVSWSLGVSVTDFFLAPWF